MSPQGLVTVHFYLPLPMGAITKRRTDADGKSYALYAEILEKGWAASAWPTFVRTSRSLWVRISTHNLMCWYFHYLQKPSSVKFCTESGSSRQWCGRGVDVCGGCCGGKFSWRGILHRFEVGRLSHGRTAQCAAEMHKCAVYNVNLFSTLGSFILLEWLRLSQVQADVTHLQI